jgi:integrase
MGFQNKHGKWKEIESVRLWYENMKAKNVQSADVRYRAMAYYCEENNTTPMDILTQAKDKTLKRNYENYIRKKEGEGKSGSYLPIYRHVLNSWLKYNEITYDLSGINIKGEGQNKRSQSESVPTKEELSKVIRKATTRAKAMIGMIAFSGVRLEVMGDYLGNDGLRIGDIEGLKVTDKIDFQKIPAMITVRPELSKIKKKYNTFLGSEGITYLKEYLEERVKDGQKLNDDSPLFALDKRGEKKHTFMRTLLVSSDIRDAMRSAGFSWRPYLLRPYFATAMTLSESKGLIIHEYRQFFMGHAGDIERVYSLNKTLLPDTIESMRESYAKCLKFLETEGISEKDIENKLSESERKMTERYLLMMGFSKDEITKNNFLEMDDEQLQKTIQDKIKGMQSKTTHKTISIKELDNYLNDGWKLLQIFPTGDKAVMELS